MSDRIVNASGKEALSDHDVSVNFYDALNEEAAQLLDGAAERADANDWKTVQFRDISSEFRELTQHPMIPYFGGSMQNQAAVPGEHTGY